MLTQPAPVIERLLRAWTLAPAARPRLACGMIRRGSPAWLLAWLLVACAAPTGDSTVGSATTEAPATAGTTAAETSSTPTTGATASTTDATTPGTGGATTGVADERPRLNHLQALGTHNSYHVSPGSLVKEWDYSHLPLDQQLDQQGVRQFELDVHFNGPGEPIDVYHVELLDATSTCATLAACLMTIKTWSDGHMAHHPVYVMFEVKSAYDATAALDLLMTLEEQILAVWPLDRLVLPDDVQGAAATLREGLAANGWPAIDDARGKLVLVLHDGELWRDAYTEGGTTTAGRLLFPDAFGDLSAPFAAVHSINDPVAQVAEIQAAVDAGHLVRTRADSDNVEPSAGDTSRGAAALMTGAHFISTDYPPPGGDKYDYVFEIPGGTPSRCNPRSAQPDCVTAMIEAL